MDFIKTLIMKKLKQFNNWFNKNLGWFFTNGRKQYIIENLSDRK